MRHLRRRALLLALLVGGIPLVTFVTCDQNGNQGGFNLFSTNDNFLDDATDFVFGGDEDDDDD